MSGAATCEAIMALIDCPDCGRRVSDAAVACPDCARPIAAMRDRVVISRRAQNEADAERDAVQPRSADNAPIDAFAAALREVSRGLEGKRCPRCGKDLRADYVMVSERTGEFCCLDCADRAGKRYENMRYFKQRLLQIGPVVLIAALIAGGIAAAVTAIAKAPTTKIEKK